MVGLIIGGAVFLGLLYLVIRLAVAHAILDADDTRAERANSKELQRKLASSRRSVRPYRSDES